MTDRKRMESAAASYTFLRGLVSIPLGALIVVAALANWEWGPFRHAWVLGVCVAVAALAWLTLTRYYNERYGRITPTTRQQARAFAATVVGGALMLGASFLVRSRADWSLDLPVNQAAAALALFMLVFTALTVGLKRHHVLIWGALLVVGLLPVWGDMAFDTASNVGLVLGGIAVAFAGIFDHRLLARLFGPVANAPA